MTLRVSAIVGRLRAELRAWYLFPETQRYFILKNPILKSFIVKSLSGIQITEIFR